MGKQMTDFIQDFTAYQITALIFFNVDGIEITSQTISAVFSKNNIQNGFKELSVKGKELVNSDSTLGLRNFYTTKLKEITPDLFQSTSRYYLERPDKKITAVSFIFFNKRDAAFERKFVNAIIHNEIPKSIYAASKTDSINFAGRYITLGETCGWMSVNNIQCSYYGQINWSIHKDQADASLHADIQLRLLKTQKKGKVISEKPVKIIFEGNETEAKQVIYDFTGVTSMLLKMSGGKYLTIYYVAAPVRNNYVSCVLSFWNNDLLNAEGLPLLLDQVMKLKK